MSEASSHAASTDRKQLRVGTAREVATGSRAAKAEVVYHGMSNGEDIEIIQIDGHRIQFGHGSGGGGFCYACQSFDCIDNLTDDQWKAIRGY